MSPIPKDSFPVSNAKIRQSTACYSRATTPLLASVWLLILTAAFSGTVTAQTIAPGSFTVWGISDYIASFFNDDNTRRGGGSPFVETRVASDGAEKLAEQPPTANLASPCADSSVTINVPADQPTIQAAINAANPLGGDKIKVASGIYQEQLIINKCVTIEGAGQGATTILSPTTLASSTTSGVTAQSIIETRSEKFVTIRDLTVSGPVPFVQDVYGILVIDNSALKMTNVRVTAIRKASGLDGVQNGNAVRAGSSQGEFNQIGMLDLTNVTVDDFQKAGIIVSRAGSSAIVTGSTVTGVGAQNLIAQNGIQIEDGATATITNNTISGLLCNQATCGPDPVNQFQSAGIILVESGLTTVSNNTISNNDSGYLIYATQSTTPQQVTGNTFTNNRYFAFYLDQSNTFIQNNFISGGNSGAVVLSYGGNASNTIVNFQSNSITGASQAGIRLIDVNQSDTFTPVVTANFNRISNSPSSGTPVIGIDALPSPASPTVSAENNFWGCNQGPNGGTGCDTTTGNVDGDPYLVLRTTTSDNDLNTGETATITADLTSNNSNQTLTGRLPDGVPITFSATKGTVSPTSSTLTNGVATTTFTAGGPFAAGDETAVVNSTVDNASAPVNININDTTNPTVTINQKAGQPDPANGVPVEFTVVFSEVVTGFDDTDVSVSGVTFSSIVVTDSGDGKTYNVAVTPTSSGVVKATVPAGAALDLAGNTNNASTWTDNQVTFFVGAIEFVVDDLNQNCLANGAPVYTTIQAAVADAGPGYIIRVCSGTYTTPAAPNPGISVTQSGLTIINAEATKPTVNIPYSASGTGRGFEIYAPNVTFDGLSFVKSDSITNHNLIGVLTNANNFTVRNSSFNAVTNWQTAGPGNTDIVSRGLEVTGGLTGLLITNNTFQNLRQPAYINGSDVAPTVTGTVSNNTVTGSKGFVVAGANLNFNGNIFGQTCAACGADISLFSNSDPTFYTPTKLLNISSTNDNAYISVQFPVNPSPSGRAVTYVDDSPVAGVRDGRTPAQARQTIQDGVNNTLPGGTVNVAAGTYPETVIVDRPLTIRGAKFGVPAKPRNVLADESTIVVGLSTAIPVDVQADNVTFDGFNFDINQTNPTTNNGGDKPVAIIKADGNPGPGGDGYQNLRLLNNRLPYSEAEVDTPTAYKNGIIVAQSTDLLIESNYIVGFPGYGTILESGSTNFIFRNNDTFNNSIAGVSTQGNFTRPAPQLKHNNVLIENNRFDRDDVLLFQIEGGIARNNTLIGGELGSGRFNLPGGNNNVDITGNTFSLSRLQGVVTYTYFEQSNNTIPYAPNSNIDVVGNTFTRLISPATNLPNSATTGSFAAIDLRGTGGTNTIANNTLSLFGTLPAGGNSSFGIRLRGSASGNFEITGNNFNGGNVTATGTALPVTGLNILSNTAAGNVPADAGVFPATSIVNVTCNTFSRFQDGISIYDGAANTFGGLTNGSNVNVNNNNIVGNTNFGVNNGGTSATLNAASNYWGAADGPGPIGPGSGDRVTPNVNFTPFLSTPSTGCTTQTPVVFPSVTITQASAQADPTSTSPVNFTVVFSEPVTGFDSSDVNLSGSTASGALTATVTQISPNDGTTYNVAVSGMTSSGTIVANIPTGAATSVATGNPTSASTSTDNSVTFNLSSAGVVVSPADLKGWAFAQEAPNGTGSFVEGPAAPPLGVGSARMTVDANGREILARVAGEYAGVRFDQITALSYSTYNNNNTNPAVAIALQFDVDDNVTDANDGFQGRLVYEPYQDSSQAVQQNVWQNWNLMSPTARFWGSSGTGTRPVAAACPQSNPCTRAQLLAAFPNLGIRNAPTSLILLRAGGPVNSNFDGNTDALTIGVNSANTTFNFEPTPPTVSISDVTANEGNAGTSNFSFTVSLSQVSQLPTTVTVTTADGTATTADSDYASTSQTVTIPAGSLSTTVDVSVNGDTTSEPTESFTVNLSNAVNAAISDGQGIGTITNDEAAVTLSIDDVTVTEGNSGTVQAIFTVTLSGQISSVVTVNYATADNTATVANNDYAPTTGTLTFAANTNVLTQTITVNVNGDTLVEPTESFFVNLTNATGGVTISDNQGVGTINRDDDFGTIQFSSPTYTVGENGGVATITVTRTGGAAQSVSVTCSTVAGGTATAGADYTTTSQVITFADQDSAPKTCSVPIVNDNLSEASETVNLLLSAVTGGAALGTPSTAVLTITDNGNFVSISGNIQQFNGSSANTNLDGVTVTLSGSATATTTTDVNGNYSFNGGLPAGGSFLVTPSLAGRVFDPISRNYASLTTNVTNANFIAYNSNNIPRKVRIGLSTATPGQTVTVPVELVSLGNENGVSFSFTYNTALLSNPQVALGSDASGATLIPNTTVPGSVGVVLALPSGQMFAAGTRQIVKVTFNTINILPPMTFNTPLVFTDSPVARKVSDPNANPLPAEFINGVVVFAQGLESDVETRPNGDGDVDLGDYIQTGRFAANLDTPDFTTSNEFQRADSEPSATKGNGVVDLGDFIQAGRYAATLDPLQTVGGPTYPINASPDLLEKAGRGENLLAIPRVVRVVNATASPGSQVTVSVEIEPEAGDLGVSFTMDYDATKLSNPQVALGSGAPGATLIPNTNNSGKVIVQLAYITGGFQAGTRQLLTITFNVAANAPGGQTPLTFNDTPVQRQIRNNSNLIVESNFVSGFVNILGPTAVNSSIAGQVVTTNGRAISRAQISLRNSQGVVRSTVSNPFGKFRFNDLEVGETYIVTVSSKGYKFTERSVSLLDNLEDLTITADR